MIKELGGTIKQKRKVLNLTQKEAAALCGVGTRFFSELENGKESLELAKVLKVIHAFGYELKLVTKKLEL